MAKIKNITIESKRGKAQTLTLEEARELYDSLDLIFGGKQMFSPPVYVETSRPLYHPPGYPWVTYGDSTKTTSANLNILTETAGEG